MSEAGSIRVIDGGGPPPPPEGQRDAARSAARAQMQADLAAELSGLDKAEEAPADATADAEQPAETPAEEPTEEAAEEPAEEAEADETPAEPEKEAKPDKDLARRLAAVQKEEKRAKAALAEERRAIAEERRAIEAEARETKARLERVEKAFARLKYDPVAIAREAGIPEEMFEDFAKAYYAASPKGQADPRFKDAAQRTAREREKDDEQSELRREVAELRAHVQQQESAQRTAAWLDNVAKAASDETPLVQTMLSKSPQKTRARLAQVAEQLLAETDEVPDPEDVVAELEKIRREELEELGIDAPAPATNGASKTKPVPPAAKTKPAKALDKDLRAPGVQGRSEPKSRDEARRDLQADIARELASGKFDA